MTEILSQPPVQELLADQEARAECSVQDVVKILIGSFRFSQGDNLLQRSILSLVAWNNRGRITPATIDEAFPMALEAANKIIKNSQVHQSTGAALSEIYQYTNYFKGCLDDAPPDLGLVTNSVINRDFTFIVNRGGRLRSEGDRITPANDPYLSQFIHYGLLGNSTGMPEYDQVFTQIVDTYKDQKGEIDAKCIKNQAPIEKMVDTYIAHHPEQAEAVRSAMDNLSVVTAEAA